MESVCCMLRRYQELAWAHLFAMACLPREHVAIRLDGHSCRDINADKKSMSYVEARLLTCYTFCVTGPGRI